jgi:F-type H+-transporting ATPase subunit delta
MKNYKVATRYAKAIFDLSVEKQLLEQSMTDMDLLASTYHASKDLQLLMASPVVKPDKKQKVIRELFGKHIGELVLNFLMILTSKGREMHIGVIAEEFLRLYKEKQGLKTVFLTTAVPVDDTIRQKVKALVAAHTGKTIELIEKVDPKILGGFVLKIDDALFDSSLNFKLNELKKEFKVNTYIKEF